MRAMKPEPGVWKDISSYSRGETKREVQSVEFCAGFARIVVTRHLHLPEEKWGLVCHELGMSSPRELEATQLEEAKLEALVIIERRLTDALTIIVGHQPSLRDG